MPQITLGLIILVVLVYIAGARYPGLAQRIGAA